MRPNVEALVNARVLCDEGLVTGRVVLVEVDRIVAMGNGCAARIIGGDHGDNPVDINEDYPAGHQAFVAQDPRVD